LDRLIHADHVEVLTETGTAHLDAFFQTETRGKKSTELSRSTENGKKEFGRRQEELFVAASWTH
jgi:hypothetical protein